MKFITVYQTSRERSAQFREVNPYDSVTQQSDKAATDINLIVKTFTQTGQLPQVQLQALYEDFSDVGDYRTAMDKLNASREAFNALPAKVRKEFDNDPGAFMDFAQNPENLDKLREMGLAKPKPVTETPTTATPPQTETK